MKKPCKCWRWADRDDVVTVDPDALEQLLDQLAARFRFGLLCPEAAEVFEHRAGGVRGRAGAGSERIELRVFAPRPSTHSSLSPGTTRAVRIDPLAQSHPVFQEESQHVACSLLLLDDSEREASSRRDHQRRKVLVRL